MRGAFKFLNILEAYGFPTYIVGGAVRDIILGNTPRDVDIVTKAKPDEIIAICAKEKIKTTDLVGKSFGVVVVTIPDGTYEITTFRKERYGAHSHKPEYIWYAESLEEDIQRRDFTVNGLAMDRNEAIIDYVGGIKDIQKETLRTIGDAPSRFAEDALRLFRACRFVGQLGFSVDVSLREGMKEAFYRVQGLSLDRVRNELDKLLVSTHVGKGLDLLVTSELANQSCQIIHDGRIEHIPILPELYHLLNLPQEKQFHAYDGWIHTLETVQHAPPDLTIRWAALLHDVAKGLPDIRAIRNNRITDYGHDHEGALITEAILLRLGYHKKMVQRVSWLVKNHMKFHFFTQYADASVHKWMRKEAQSRAFRKTADLAEACAQLTEVCIADVKGSGRPNLSSHGSIEFGESLQGEAARMPIHTSDLNYSNDITRIAGDKTGEVLHALLTRVQNGQLENEADALREAAMKWLARHVQK